MKLGRVIGGVEVTTEDGSSSGAKLMVVQPLDARLQPVGSSHPALDMVGTVAGDLVLLAEDDKSAPQMVERGEPVRIRIVAIATAVEVMAREDTGRGSLA